MKPRTKKRAAQERQYRNKRDEFIDSHPHICFFCDHFIQGTPDLHHLRGRDGDRLLEEDDWVMAHRECHRMYHSQPWTKLPWWNGYIYRLKVKSPLAYGDEMLKISKK